MVKLLLSVLNKALSASPRKNIFLLALLLASATSVIAAPTTINGNITANTTWSAAGSPYTIAANVVVNSGVTLTIQAGTIVQFNNNLSMTVLGTLNATGANFTTSAASPAAGNWNYIYIGNSSNTATATFNTCNILYGSGVRVEKGTANFDGTGISNIPGDALYLANGGNLSLLNSTISGVGRALYANSPGTVNLQNTSVSKTTNEGFYITNSVATTAVTFNQLTLSETGSYGVFANYTPNLGSFTFTNSTLTNTKNNAIRLVDIKTATLNKVSTSNTLAGYTNAAGLYVSGPSSVGLTEVALANANYPIELYMNGTGGAPQLTYAGNYNFSTNNTFKVVYVNSSRLDAGTLQLDSLNIPYYFNQTFTVGNGTTLRVSSGSILKFADGAGLDVAGTLNAEARVGGRINFTSFRDDNLGGDSNNNANQNAPASQNWYGVRFMNTSTTASLMRRCTVKFAGYRHGNSDSHRGAVTVENSAPTINLCSLTNSAFGAVFRGAAAPVFTNNTLASSDLTPVAMSFEANPTFTNNLFSSSDNTYDAIGLLGGELVADANLIKRDFTSIPNVTYVMLDDITVPSNRRLTIAPGVVIKSFNGRSILVSGNMTAIGTVASPIIFTSISDDNFGNPQDTQKDGTNRVPVRSDFGSIIFMPGSGASSTIQYCTLKFSNGRGHHVVNRYIEPLGPIQVVGSNPVLKNNVIQDVNVGIASYLGATPTITDNTVTNVAKVPFALSASSNPTFVGNTFTSVGWKALGIIDENVTSNSTIRKRDLAGYTNITYVMMNDLTVSEGANLTIEAGLVIKFANRYSRIFVNGGLALAGTPTSKITLTHLADDNAGASSNATDNDTEGNGNGTKPNAGDWGGIWFNPSTNDAFSKIENTDILYGGTGYGNLVNDGVILIDAASPSFTNVNINQSGTFGFNFKGVSTPVLTNVAIRNCSWDPFAISLFADPTFTNITMVQNGSNGLRIIDQVIGSNATIKRRSFGGIDNVAYIGSTMEVAANATLTIEPGVVVKFTNSYWAWDIKGVLKAIGTATDKIYFTSFKDDSRGGDTNIDGNNSVPAAGNWEGLQFFPTSRGSEIRNAEIRYASIAVDSDGSNAIISNNVIELISDYALRTRNSATTTFTNNSLRNIGYTPVIMSPFDSPVLTGNTIQNVGLVGISLLPETISQSATLPQRSFAGFNNITYVLPGGGFTVNEGSTLTIPAGIVFKKQNGSPAITVNGKLVIAGTAASPVIFTHLADDQYGSPLDTEQNGTLTSPKTLVYQNGGNWINFAAISDDASSIDRAIFRYMYGDAIVLSSASPKITNNTFEFSNYGVRNTGISEPTITGNTFKDLVNAPITISLVAYPAASTNNIISGTTWKGIEVNNETLTQDITLAKRSFGGITNIPYIFNNYRVGPGVTLTIAPGVVNKFHHGAGMIVDGALKAVGAANNNNTIVFTSLTDDFYGGDTNADTTHTAFNANYWTGITYENASMDDKSILNHCIFRQANHSSYGAIKLVSASPSISNSLFDSNYHGLVVTGASKPTLDKNDFTRITDFGINNTGSFELDAKNSWWGHNSGPKHISNPEGLGSKVSNNVLFTPWGTQGSLNPLAGDVSLNGSVTAYDAAMVLQSAVGSLTLNAKQAEVADVSGNSGVTAMDASFILQYASNKIQYFPSESTNKRTGTKQTYVSTKSAVSVQLSDVALAPASSTITLPVALQNVGDLHALQTALSYDPQVLEFVGVEKAENGAAVGVVHAHDAVTGKIGLAFAQATGLQQDGGFVNLQFNVLNKKIGQTFVTMGKTIGNETDVTTLTKSATITINSQALTVSQVLSAKDLVVYPNPSADVVNVAYKLDKTGHVKVTLVNAQGQMNRDLLNQEMAAGENSLRFSRTELGLPAGMYLLKITADGKTKVQQVVLH